MGIDAGNSSKTLDFFIFCNATGRAGITEDGQGSDVTIVPKTTAITEINTSNYATQGRIHPNVLR